MTTDNPTSPKGSGGPPTEPGWYWVRWNAEEFDGASWVGDGTLVAVYWKPNDEWPVRVPDNGYTANVVREWGPRIPTPDESEPAPPTSGPSVTLAEEVSRLVHAFSDDGRRLAVRDLAHRVGAALAESRAEVARDNAEIAALRDRVRALESLLRMTKCTLAEARAHARDWPERNAIDIAIGDIAKALTTTQEPPAKEPTP